MSVDGTYDISIHSLQGPQQTTVVLVTDGTSVSGTATRAEGDAKLQEPAYQGNAVTWKLPTTVPMPMTLEFEAVVDGDSISGVVKIGAMATTPFDGHRV